MSKAYHTPFDKRWRTTLGRAAGVTGYLLTLEDRIGIERLVYNRGTRESPLSPVLHGFLRHKLQSSSGAPEPTPRDLVVAGRHVTFSINDGEPCFATLSMRPLPFPDHIPVASFLGATLIGMRVLQKAPLLRKNGRIDTVFVMDVAAPCDPHAA